MTADALRLASNRVQQLTRFAAIAALCATACTTATSSGPDGAGGSGTGVGGAQGSGGRTGAGGSNGGGTGGTGGMTGGGSGGQGGTPAGSGGTGGAGGAVARACPTDATFCSGFEEAGMPAGAVYKANAAPGDWTRDFALDTTLHNSGAASLRVKSSMDAGTSGSAYKMLAVPAPSGKFWVRFYVRSELDMGSVDHNAFVEAAGSDDPNDGVFLELAEDAGIAFNSHDDVRWPATYGRLTTGTVNPFVLPKAVWHCVEISFDSTARAQMLFLNGTQQINVTDYPSAAQLARPFTVFRFGFSQLHGPPRQMWYDDVAVGPNRMPCF